MLDSWVVVTSGLVVYEKTITANLAELPFMATENILMAAVQAGGDRQELHEVIRTHSQAQRKRVKAEARRTTYWNDYAANRRSRAWTWTRRWSRRSSSDAPQQVESSSRRSSSRSARRYAGR
ncbi:MAG: hypothetical protein R3C45_03700 [Phycisphaerales bacterium]